MELKGIGRLGWRKGRTKGVNLQELQVEKKKNEQRAWAGRALKALSHFCNEDHLALNY